MTGRRASPILRPTPGLHASSDHRPIQIAQPHSTATYAVVDLDNTVRHPSTGRQGQLDYRQFAEQLRQRGVVAGTICRNRPFSHMAEQLWAQFGLNVVSTRTNCDDFVCLAAVNYVLQRDCRDLILVAGDGDYFEPLSLMRACGVHIEIWSRRHKLARSLRAVAHRVRYIDHLVSHPSDPFEWRAAA